MISIVLAALCRREKTDGDDVLFVDIGCRRVCEAVPRQPVRFRRNIHPDLRARPVGVQ